MDLVCLLHGHGGVGVVGSGGIAEHSVGFCLSLIVPVDLSEVCVCQSVCQNCGMLM